jgi:hypothetical protein
VPAFPNLGWAGDIRAAVRVNAIPRDTTSQKEMPIMNKEAYVQKFQAQIKEWNADLDKLQAKAQNAEADTKIKLDEQLTALRR